MTTYDIEPKPTNSSFNDGQWQAIHQTGTNILVSASAGSGKTTVLIERIINHIYKQYAEIDQLLIVTFTESAAREMKERLEVKFKEIINTTNDSTEKKKYLNQMNLLPQSHIQTLHSFCLFVVQKYFYLIDLNPNFKLVVDETEIKLIQQNVWDAICESIVEQQIDDFSLNDLEELLSIYSNSKSDKGLFDLVVNVHQFAKSHPEPRAWISNISKQYENFDDFENTSLYNNVLIPQIQNSINTNIQLIERAKSELLTLSNETIEKYTDTLEVDFNSLQNINNLLKTDSLKELIDGIQLISFDRWPTNSKKSEDYEMINHLKTLRDQYKKNIETDIKDKFKFSYENMQEIENKIYPIINQLSKLILIYDDYLSKYKNEMNIIDYNDLEHFTLEILAPINEVTGKREPSIAAKYFSKQFKEIMIDEYQDINEIQATILYWLSNNSIDESKGNLFMVGDVKQSIYGFRLAEPNLFINKYKDYNEHNGGELIILDQNYRSRDEVLQFSNFLFERIMDRSFGEMNYGINESLKTGNVNFQKVDNIYNVEFLITEKEQNIDNSYFNNSLEVEAHTIAQKIISLMKNDFQIFDKKQKKMRTLDFKDIVILSSTKNTFQTIQNVFEQYDIPLFSQKIESYFQRQEIQIVLSLLKIIDNPYQDIPMVAVLRSFFVGLTDEELSIIRINCQSHTFYDALLVFNNNFNNQSDEVSKKIYLKTSNFLSQLEKWRQLSYNSSIVELIWTIYEDTHYLDFVVGLSNGNQRLANLHGLYEQAEKFEKDSYKSVFQFVQFIEKMIENKKDLAEPIILNDNQNFVRIMTIHASKGLEFPLVFLMNTGKQFNLQDTKSKYIVHRDYGLSSDYYDVNRWLTFPSIINQLIRIDKENKLKAEEMRKLYVALTRCEQKLIITGTVKNIDQWNNTIESTKYLSDNHSLMINQNQREKANSWLDWLNMSIAISQNEQLTVASFSMAQLDIQFINLNNLLEGIPSLQKKEKFSEEKFEQFKQDIIKKEQQYFNNITDSIINLWNIDYSYSIATKTSSYQSVSELKRMNEEPLIEKIDTYTDRRVIDLTKINDKENENISGIRYTQDTFQPPSFILNNQKLTYAEIGSLTHEIMQFISFEIFEKKEHTKYAEILETEISRIEQLGNIKNEDIQYINKHNILSFLTTDFGQFIIENQEHLKREQAFSFRLPAKDMFALQIREAHKNELENDYLIVHGVIDGYILLEDTIHLFDYKTDKYRSNLKINKEGQIQNIIKKYQFQIDMYKEALQSIYPKHNIIKHLILLDFEQEIII